MRRNTVSLFFLLATFLFPLQSQETRTADEQRIREVNKQYVDSWLRDDEQGVVSLFETDAIITPNGSGPIKGIEAIRAFWFPIDSSTTTIHQFTSEILAVEISDNIAYSSQKTFLSWSYEKGSTRLGKDQWGYAMTVYRKQPNGSWKVWRQTWIDVRSKDRL